MNRYKFVISYMGGAFLGSQKQPSKKTVFNTIESVFNTIFKQSIVCIPCGRTDSGVNASYMAFHADFTFLFNHDHLKQRLNNHLIPEGIIIRSIDLMDNSFHALSSAISRSYRYFFTFDDSLPHYLLHSVSLINQQPLFIPSSSNLQFLKGRRNFKFLSNKSDNQSLIRDIYSVSLTTQLVDDLFGNSCNIYCFEIVSNGFLYRMVRHIVGLLLHSMVNFTNMDYLKDYIIVHRGISYCLAPAKGLHLIDVKY